MKAARAADSSKSRAVKQADSTRSWAAGTNDFAAMVGHELNNIVVPLEGYADMAADRTAATESVRQSLEEMRTAIGRIKALAADLGSLAEPSAAPIAVAIGDCMRDDVDVTAAETPAIDWRCNASTAVAVDRPHARRAIKALSILAARPASSPSQPVWEISLGSPAPAHCASCGAAARRKKPCVLVRTPTDRPVTTEALRHPFGSARAGRLSRRLALAALVYSAHCANGHIFLDDDTGVISIAFPVA